MPDLKRFGKTIERGGQSFTVELFDDPRGASEDATDAAFDRWNVSLSHWETRGPIDLRRIELHAIVVAYRFRVDADHEVAFEPMVTR